MIVLLHVVVLGLTAGLGWWLSGFDSNQAWNGHRRELVRRAVRCAVTLVLVEVALTGLIRWCLYKDRVGGWIYIALTLPLGIVWSGCFSELFARGFQRLVFPEDNRAADLGESRRALDQLSVLVREGKREEAIQFCHQLRESGNVSDQTVDAMLSRLGAEPSAVHGEGARKATPLGEADGLRARGQFSEAEAKLAALLKREPSNQAAALMLMQLYAQDLRAPDKAAAVLQRIASERFIPPAFIEYAQRSLVEWSQPRAKTGEGAPEEAGQTTEPASAAGQSVEELLANGYLGSAIELLEQQLKERPDDFGLWMKLAEAQGVHCGNLGRATKIIERLEGNPAFSPEQVRAARAKLKEWKGKQASR